MTIAEGDEVEIETASRASEMYLEPRCRVCRNDTVRLRVNELLASGFSYAGVIRALGEGNAIADQRDRVSVDSIRNHALRHFPVQNVAKATYRDILERRAKENGIDFVNGLMTAITPLAFLETVMVRGYETLVEPGTEIDVKTAIVAASRLQELLDAQAGQADVAQMMAQMNRVIEVVRTHVPRERWPALQAALTGVAVANDGQLAKTEEPVIRMVEIDDGDDDEDELRFG